ncbi:30S ribosomal protein S8 [Candidatus Solincola tengchongensis]|uniref:30S ribosomal protein S8 n=1 Tax=Candidatus Solincola tengchongensis TaxID=2900693 RepID=UPI00257EC623|nr:30S ribosomal protein S8 [Candidatus Solincola tengchongensis]
MTMTDPIADMLTRIRNASAARHEWVEMPNSGMKQSIAQILKREGFIADFEVVKGKSYDILRIKLAYGPNRESLINGIKRISKPGLRVYAKKAQMPRVLGGLGIAIISTSKGLLTDREAREKNVGGEVIAYVW